MLDQFPLLAEALRRRATNTQSGAGIPGGMMEANNNMPGNPVAQTGMNPTDPMVQGQLPPSPDGGDSTKGAREALANALPNEANMIIKSLTKTLERLTGQ